LTSVDHTVRTGSRMDFVCVIRKLPVIESVNRKKKMKESHDVMNYTFTVKSDLPKLSSVNRDLNDKIS